MKLHIRSLAVTAVVLLAALAASAEEGIWLFNKIPDSVKQEIKKDYNFELTQPFLDHLRTASVHFGGASGSFVSPEGLLFTNHHVANTCVQNLSTKENDYMSNGFQAKTRAEEQKCPGTRVRVLLEISDVTARVQGVAESIADQAEANKQRKAEIAKIENACSEKGFDCQVVTLYAGGRYNLYRYKEYDDVRLVFAPEYPIAFFGGDPDNFSYPRFCLDITFLRAYENGQPAKPENYLRWSKEGTKVGQLQFVSGHPGSTGRLETLSQLEFSRDVAYPLLLGRIGSLIATAKEYSQLGEEQKRIALEEIFGLENSQKALTGFLSGLRDESLMNEKREQENKLRAAVSANGELEKKYGSLWNELADAFDRYRKVYQPYTLKESYMGRGSTLFGTAKRMARYAEEITKPTEDRLRGYNEAAIPNLKRRITGNVPIHKDFEVVMLANSLDALSKAFPRDEAVKQALAGKSPLEAAKMWINDSKLDDVEYRKKLMEDPELIRKSDDPMFRLVRILEPGSRELLRTIEDEIESVTTPAQTKIAQARFGVYGENDYPDATLTLRLSYGPVKGYTEKDGTVIPPYTTLGGTYDKATGKDPYILPQSWLKAKDKLRKDVPYNYITTADIHGGNSGSPAVDTKGEVVGIVFDGNIPSLPNRFIYQDRTARAVFVSSQSIVETLDKIYGAEHILKELGVR